MAKLSTLYATALLDLAVQGGEVGEFYKQTVFLRNLLQEDECQSVLLHPRIPNAEKYDIFGNVLDGEICDELLALLFLTIEKNREKYLVPALTKLIDMTERYQGLSRAKVTSASELRKPQIKVLKKTLSVMLNKQVEVSQEVDPSVIGGPYIRVDGYSMDMTVKRRLRDMTDSMKERCEV